MKRLCFLLALLGAVGFSLPLLAQDAQGGEEPPQAEGEAPAEGAAAEGEESPSARRAREEREAREEAQRAKAEREAREKAQREEAERQAREKAEAERKQKEEQAKAEELPDDVFEPLPDIEPEKLQEAGVTKSYPYIEHHGMFRFRADSFNNLDLNTTGTSPILPPPAAFPVNPDDPDSVRPDADADWYAGANIRFRYNPTIHIYEDLSIHLQMDLPDNLVLGSFPDGPRAEVPTLAFSSTQVPPEGRFGPRIKQAYAQVKPFFGVVRVGRMASHWGLGILANGGQCADCDFGDSVDRAMLLTKLFDFYLVGAWDFAAEGPWDLAASDPYSADGRFLLGQPRDNGEIDDVNQYVFAIFRKALTDEDKANQERILKEERRPVINGGFYLVYRDQEASHERVLRGEAYDATNPPQLDARGAEAWIPDLWLQFLWEPRFQSKLRLELEVTGIYGQIDFVTEAGEGSTECFSDPEAEGCNDRGREIHQLGAAFESEYQHNKFLSFGLNAGYATGRKNFGFQLNDGRLDPLDQPSNFRFDRDYIVDMILFREIIGAVTNATYFKPWAQFEFPTALQRDTIGLNLSAIYSRAVEAEATPSGEAPLGLEFNALAYYKEEGKFQADIGYGLLVPLAAFDEAAGRPRLFYPDPNFQSPTFDGDNLREADIAQTIQARMFWFF